MIKRFRKNNKGYSLVELIVSFALLAIVALAVLMVMNAGSNMFNSVDNEIDVQYKSQAAMSQFQQYFLGCSKAICATTSDGVTYFADSKTVYAFRYSESDEKIYFASADYDFGDTSSVSNVLTAMKPENITDPFCSDVTAFTASVTTSAKNAQSVRLTLTVKNDGNKTAETSQVFTFRNTPSYISAPAEDKTMLETLIAALNPETTTTTTTAAAAA